MLCRLYHMATAEKTVSYIVHWFHIVHTVTTLYIPMFTLCVSFYSVLLPVLITQKSSSTPPLLYFSNHKSIHVAAIWAGQHPVVNVPDPLSIPFSPPPRHPLESHIYRWALRALSGSPSSLKPGCQHFGLHVWIGNITGYKMLFRTCM